MHGRVGWDDNGGVGTTMPFQNGQTDKGTDAHLLGIPDPPIAGGVAEFKIILALKAAAGGGGGGEKAHDEEQGGYGKTRIKSPFKGGDRSREGRHLPALVAQPNTSLRAPTQALLFDRLGQALPPLTLSQSPLIALATSPPMLLSQTTNRA